jgi:uncharacterized protein (UPF0218 family)
MSVNPEQQIQSIHVDGEPDLADLINVSINVLAVTVNY